MIRLSKLTDYGLVLMSYVARSGGGLHTARGLAAESGLPLPTVSKVLKTLLQSGFLVSHRGINGGYNLARGAQEIISGLCDFERGCPIKTNQRIINQVVRGALEKLTLADLIHPLQLIAIKDARGRLVPSISLISGSTQ